MSQNHGQGSIQTAHGVKSGQRGARQQPLRSVISILDCGKCPRLKCTALKSCILSNAGLSTLCLYLDDLVQLFDIAQI